MPITNAHSPTRIELTACAYTSDVRVGNVLSMEENPRFARRRQANVQGDMESKQIAPFSHFIRPLSYVSGGTGSVPNSTGSIPATTLSTVNLSDLREQFIYP